MSVCEMYRVRFGRKNRLGSVAQSTEYKGIYYDSKREAREAFDLDLQFRAGEIDRIERQVRISLDVNRFHICNYIIDFVIYWKKGVIEYREVKGFETEIWRMKWKIFEALYSSLPNVILTVVR